MAAVGFEAKQAEDTPVTQVDYGVFRVRHAYTRSYERVTGNRPSNDYLEWKADPERLVFAVCDGIETSHASGATARFMGRRLVEWLAALTPEQADDLDGVRQQLAAALAAWMPDAQRATRSTIKAGEAIFLCGWVAGRPDGLRGFLAGVGLVAAQLFDRKERTVSFTPTRHAYDRWSTLRGLRGQVFVEGLGPRPPLQRLIVFTDGLSGLEEKVAAYAPGDLQAALLESFHSVLNDDISLLDIQYCDPPLTGRARKSVFGAQPQSPVRIERVEDDLEWEMRPEAVYSILEMRQGSKERVVSAGDFYTWRPPLQVACSYRVCLVSPAGRAYSDWLPWEPTSNRLDNTYAGEEETGDVDMLEEDDRALPQIVEVEPWPVEEMPVADDLPFKTPPDAEPHPEPAPALAEQTEPVSPAPPVPLAEEAIPPQISAPDESAEPVNIAVEHVEAVSSLPVDEQVLAPEPETPGSLDIAPGETDEAVPQSAPDDQPRPGKLPAWLNARPSLGKLPSLGTLWQRARALLPGARGEQSGAAESGAGGLHTERGKYPGQYVLHWPAVHGANEYEVWDQPADGAAKGSNQRISDTHLRFENLSPGLHLLHVRPVGAAFSVDWRDWPAVGLDVPRGVRTAPTDLRAEAAEEDTMLRLHWLPTGADVVEEYWVFEVGREEHRLIGKTDGAQHSFTTRKTSAIQPRRFVVRAVNWGGLGPASEPALYQPGQAQTAARRMPARLERHSQPVASEQRIQQTPELCEAVNRWAKSQNVQMSAIKLEQRYENVDQYLLLESRKLNQLITLPLLKGPEYRLTVYGTRGEVLVAEIRFEKRTWVYLVKFLPTIRRG